MKQPLVSVIMPAYNASQYIEEAITSVLKQTYENLELIVIDDCSTDNTYELICEICKNDSRIAVYRNEKNQGVAKTRNKGFKLAQGEYVALLDSDDVWHSNKIEKQVMLAIEAKADIIYCSYGMVDAAGKKIGNDFIVPKTTDFSKMLKKSVISCSTAMLSKEIVKTYSFNKNYYHEDYIFWLNCLENGYSAVGIEEVLADYRILSKSRSSNKINSAVHRWKIYREYLKLPLLKAVYNWFSYVILAFVKYM